jgi:hypothetical protein
MFFARYFRYKDPWWFKMHRALQVIECLSLLTWNEIWQFL